jgi:hypothetical protein
MNYEEIIGEFWGASWQVILTTTTSTHGDAVVVDAELTTESPGCCPEQRYWYTVHIAGKRNHLGAGVEHHSTNPAFT